jgi:hypothetical protein
MPSYVSVNIFVVFSIVHLNTILPNCPKSPTIAAAIPASNKNAFEDNMPRNRIPQVAFRRIRGLIRCFPEGVMESKFKLVYKQKYNENLMDVVRLSGAQDLTSLVQKMKAFIRVEVDSAGTARFFPAAVQAIKKRRGRSSMDTYPLETATPETSAIPSGEEGFSPAMVDVIKRLKSQKDVADYKLAQKAASKALHNAIHVDSGPDAPRGQVTGGPPTTAAPPKGWDAHAGADEGWKAKGWSDSSSADEAASLPLRTASGACGVQGEPPAPGPADQPHGSGTAPLPPPLPPPMLR